MLFLTATPGRHLGLGEALVDSLLGYAVVFFGLILLMIVVMIIGRIFAAKDRRAAEKAAVAPAAAAEAPAKAEAPTAPGSAGELKLYNVEPKTAAMLMAIVADKMGKPLNELRFISIKEVK